MAQRRSSRNPHHPRSIANTSLLSDDESSNTEEVEMLVTPRRSTRVRKPNLSVVNQSVYVSDDSDSSSEDRKKKSKKRMLKPGVSANFKGKPEVSAIAKSIFDIDDKAKASGSDAKSVEIFKELNLSESSTDDSDDITCNQKEDTAIITNIGETNPPDKEFDTISNEQKTEETIEWYDFSKILSHQKEIHEISMLASKSSSNRSQKNTSRRMTRNKTEPHNCSIDSPDVRDILQIGEKKSFVVDDDVELSGDECDDDNEDQADNLKGLEITIEESNKCKRPKKKCDPLETELKRQQNLERKQNQLFLHQAHLLCLIASGTYINAVLNREELLGIGFSLIPDKKYYPPMNTTVAYVKSLLSWFTSKMKVVRRDTLLTASLCDNLMEDFACCRPRSQENLVYLFVIIARVLGLQCRLVINLNTVPLRPPIQKISKNVRASTSVDEKKVDDSSSSDDEIFNIIKEKTKKGEPISKLVKEAMKSKSNKNTVKTKSNKNTVKTKSSTRAQSKRKVVSTDEEDSKKKKPKLKKNENIWSEVYIESQSRWITVDVLHNSVDCEQSMGGGSVSYVLAWNADGTITDVTRKYCSQWHICVKSRVNPVWWNNTLAPWKPAHSHQNEKENRDMQQKIEDLPFPKAISDFKDHPLYVLKRHLLKFEALYPEAKPLGQIKGEDIYPRASVVELHTKEGWMKKGKVVKTSEEPYKIVKARPKREKGTGKIIRDLPLNLYGVWQIQPYVPPPAVDGKVPRNDYGNVELYLPSMLPKGTVHLQLPGLGRVAKKLDIDCAPAVVGWEFSGGGSHPVFDGFIVCEEYKQLLIDAWNRDIDESEKRNKETKRKRVLQNWLKLVKAIVVRNRLKGRYEFKFEEADQEPGGSKDN